MRTGINLAKELNKLSKLSKIPAYTHKINDENTKECCHSKNKTFSKKNSNHHNHKNESYTELKYLVVASIAIATSAAVVGFITGNCSSKKRSIFSDLF